MNVVPEYMCVLAVLRGMSDEMGMEELRRTVEGLARPFLKLPGTRSEGESEREDAQSSQQPLN